MSNDDQISSKLWTVKLNFRQTLSGDVATALSDTLEDAVVSVFLHNQESADGDNWTVTLNTFGPPDTDDILERVSWVVEDKGIAGPFLDLANIMAEPLPQKDWLQHVHDNFPPVQLGSFFIYGSHYKEKETLPKNLILLQIDAATAFGSGEHETTQGCIRALEYLKKDHTFKNGLDMGCGSGILAIALIKLWPDARVTAVDIDPESTLVTQRHATMNSVDHKITAATGDGYQLPLVSENAPYDIVVANILANPLIEMAPDLTKVLAPKGFAILSGLLKRQKADVVAAHEKQGLRLIHAEEIGEWQALVLQK